MKKLLGKMSGVTTSPPRASVSEIFISWLGGFLGLFLVGWLGDFDVFGQGQSLFLIGSFGASAVLIYGIPDSNFAQPRNLVGGHLVSALTGVTVYFLLPDPWYLSGALAVAFAIALMHLSKTLHPPGGATALIAVIGQDEIHNLGYWYAITPVTEGALIMLLVALLVNNLTPGRRYPRFWW